MTGVLLRRGETQRKQGMCSCDDKGRGWSDTATGRPRTVGNHRNGERRGRCLPWSLQIECHPANTLILGF